MFIVIGHLRLDAVFHFSTSCTQKKRQKKRKSNSAFLLIKVLSWDHPLFPLRLLYHIFFAMFLISSAFLPKQIGACL
jgi:hypothetical protein